MWQGKSKNKDNHSEKPKLGISRWRFIVAIVFLFSFSLIYKLFALQVNEGDLYKARAARQHEYSSLLSPDRGKIFFVERAGGSEKLFAVATSKDMATVYSIPKDVIDPKEMSEKFFLFFEKTELEAKFLENNPKTDIPQDLIATSTKENAIAAYMKRFDKPGDAYEPLNKRLDIDKLLELYSFLLKPSYELEGEIIDSPLRAYFFDKNNLEKNGEILVANLEFKNGKIFYNKDEESFELIIPGLAFDMGKFRYYPEKEIGSQLLGYVSYVDGEGSGHYGLEEFFNTELFGTYGSLKSEKGAGNLMIVNDREYVEPVSGADLVLTIDRNIESFACNKLKESVKKHEASGGSVIIIEPKTGSIIAMCSEPNFNPNEYTKVDDLSYFSNPAVLYQYEPGSVFKVITMAAAIDQNKVKPSTTYHDDGQIMITGWSKPIRNSDFSTKGAHGLVDMNYVLDNSLNTGAIWAMRQTGVSVFADYVKDFGFGERTGVELGAEGLGSIANLLRNRVREIDAATASFGQGISTTPLQMVMSYQAIANKGVLMQPHVVKKIIRGDKEEIINPKKVRQVIKEDTAETMLAMLVNIVEKGHSQKAKIDGYYIGGKTGTAQIATVGGYKKGEYIHTFIGVAPIENPAFVMLTKIDSPKDVQYAEGSAVPLWRDIADFVLKYYQIPKTRN